MSTATASSSLILLADTIIFYLLPYAYPISFFGSLFYGISTIVKIEPLSIIVNEDLLVFINFKIGILGLISLFHWYKNSRVPIISATLVPWGTQMIKTTH
jgi:hypothetical protein